MILDIIAYLIIAATVVWVLWRIFFKKDKRCSCTSGCDGCPYCSNCSKYESKR
ncbi:MAG: FeoB-associated Cys-rich membrane protein [Bacteroidales bacterium]|nr:FeoB-associated Cys-rich membrane protein [Bacteroidales bacterium]